MMTIERSGSCNEVWHFPFTGTWGLAAVGMSITGERQEKKQGSDGSD
jgi:hypothetical protein